MRRSVSPTAAACRARNGSGSGYGSDQPHRAAASAPSSISTDSSGDSSLAISAAMCGPPRCSRATKRSCAARPVEQPGRPTPPGGSGPTPGMPRRSGRPRPRGRGSSCRCPRRRALRELDERRSLAALALWRKWRHNGAMPSVQIKDVPEDAHAVLRRRAADAHQSLQEYLRSRLIAEASRPTLGEVLDRAGGRAGGSVTLKAATRAVRDDRARR
jgi:antitoxin FitA